MNNAVKGTLLSVVVFPGLGQIVLRRRIRGAVLAFASMAGLSATGSEGRKTSGSAW